MRMKVKAKRFVAKNPPANKEPTKQKESKPKLLHPVFVKIIRESDPKVFNETPSKT